ncbi:MAG: ankyrin repeat domain-containing protein [Ardenticatenales bacterium]
MPEPSSADPIAPDIVRTFVAAGHSDLATVQTLLAQHPTLLNVGHEWRPGDIETAVQAAAHVGNRPIAEFLLGQGAQLSICTAAMLGRADEVDRLLADDPARIGEPGAHGIPLLAHAALSGDADLVASLHGRGAREGVSFALHNAARRGIEPIVRYLLANDTPDLAWQDFQGKTAREVAEAGGHSAVVALLD